MDTTSRSARLITAIAMATLMAATASAAGQAATPTGQPAATGARAIAGPAAREVDSAASLRSTYTALRDRLEHSPFGQPLHLESVQSADSMRGDIVARVDRPFPAVRDALRDARDWCKLLILHPNIQQCQTAGADTAGRAPQLLVQVGRAAHPVAFTYDLAASDADYLDVQLFAKSGPLGTRDYRIRLRAAPLDERQTLMHLAFSHAYGVRARLAMQAYLATFGQGKVGFTVVDRSPDGRPVYVGDFRGALERNAMRYFLAIEAYLDSLSAPADQQADRRIRAWYAHTERYPTQLREEPDYLELKRQAVRAQVAGEPTGSEPAAQRGG